MESQPLSFGIVNGLPGDIVGAARFLAGPSSGFTTGQRIVVDGGAYRL